jgi:hypothetical protein
MTGFTHFLFLADMLTNCMAGLAVCLIVYLCWLIFREKRQRRNDQQKRSRQRRGHWGYE